jgi:outer membrane scaffolding protein for murein synthesis (MipA/OmpV family)
VTGHSGVVADLGVDFVARQHEQFEARIGPRLGLATDDYMDTYFGVRQAAAVLQPYDPDGGLRDAGIEAEATYALTDTIRLHGYAAYNRFIGDAGDSPIVDAGNQDEVRVGLGISYRFGLDLY